MKKLMIAASAALCAAVGLADIESNNIVGYNQDTLEAGKFYIKAAQFQDVESGEIDLNKVCSGFKSVPYDDDFNFWMTAPQIQVLGSSGGYDIYYYLTDGYYQDEKGEDAFKEGWCNGAGTLVDLILPSGKAFWVKVPGEVTSRTTSGAVSAEDVLTVSIPKDQFTLVSNPFPMALQLNGSKVKSSDMKPVPYDDNFAFWKTAPQIQIQKPDGYYDIYYYLSDGYVETAEGEDYIEGWCNGAGTIVDVTVEVGAGFWLKNVANSVTLEFTK